MGTIADKLAYTKQAREEIRAVIVDKGVECPGDAPFCTFDEYIAQISGGGSGNSLELKEVSFDGKDMSTWTQLNRYVTYNHSFSNNVNRFTNYVGGGYFERWYKQLPPLEAGKNYVFKFKMWSPTGFTYGNYGGQNKCYAIVSDSILSNDDWNGFDYIDSTTIKSLIILDPSTASTVPREYAVFFTFNKKSSSYPYFISIDTGDITDGVNIELDISDIGLYEVVEASSGGYVDNRLMLLDDCVY